VGWIDLPQERDLWLAFEIMVIGGYGANKMGVNEIGSKLY
jgi:hypothetical protein